MTGVNDSLPPSLTTLSPIVHPAVLEFIGPPNNLGWKGPLEVIKSNPL